MHKNNIIFALFLASTLFFSGCTDSASPRNTSSGHGSSNANPWAQQTNVDAAENIDTSDLDETISASELGMTEEMPEQKMKRIAFPVSEYKAYSGIGKGTIKGNIYVTNAYGERINGSGTRLYLNPVTSYSNQWYTASYVGGNKMEKADSRLFNYLKFTASDSNGAFAFYGVPSGSYYLIGTVTCGTQCGFDSEKSIRIATRVSVYGNNVVMQDLTRSVN